MVILAVDIGTSSTKVTAWGEDGARLANVTTGYGLTGAEALSGEIDADRWWTATVNGIGAALAAAGVSGRNVRCVAIDGIGWTLLPLDASFRPLRRAITWLDRRAEPDARALLASGMGPRLVALDANPIDAAYVVPKIRWLSRTEPAVFERARWFATTAGFVAARLTGKLVMDETEAYGFHCFNIAEGAWERWAAEDLGIGLDRLPALVRPGVIAGGVTSEAAAATGIKPRTPVLAGCVDAVAGALGAGVVRLGQTQDQGGQAGGLGVAVDRIVVEPRLVLSRHLVPGQYLFQSATVGGGSLSWFRELLGMASDSAAISLEQLSEEAAASAPGAGGLIFLPYMRGERTPYWSSVPRGTFIGLSYDRTRGDLSRAIMEGCAYAQIHGLRLVEQAGFGVTELLGAGGATQSPLWCQIKADVMNRPFVSARDGAGRPGGHGLGLFALASVATGLHSSLAECIDTQLTLRHTYEPDSGRHATYAELFEIYDDVARSLMPAFGRLEDRATRGGPL
jgi:xylulokinase